MRFARVEVRDHNDDMLWRGSLRQFARDNQFNREQLGDVAENLRVVGTAAFGGGAAPSFLVRTSRPKRVRQ